jgi:hypothetical protein
VEYFELFCIPEIAEVIVRETDWYAQTFLESMPNLKLSSRTHYWNEMNRSEIMKSLAFFLLQELHQKPDNKRDIFPEKNSGNTWNFYLAVRRGFTFYSSPPPPRELLHTKFFCFDWEFVYYI